MSLVNLRFIADFENAPYQLSPLVLLSLSLSPLFPLMCFMSFKISSWLSSSRATKCPTVFLPSFPWPISSSSLFSFYPLKDRSYTTYSLGFVRSAQLLSSVVSNLLNYDWRTGHVFFFLLSLLDNFYVLSLFSSRLKNETVVSLQ